MHLHNAPSTKRARRWPGHQRAESGQAAILIAFLIIGLLAMTGLAIDGGGVLLMERDLQNAVDNAVLAATYAKCTGGDVQHAAQRAAAKSGFENGVDGVIVTVDDNPPEGSNFVRVTIQAEKEKYFIQLVYNDPLILAADGVGNCKPAGGPVGGGGEYAVFAGSETCGNAIDLATADTDINGNTHTNNDLKSNKKTTINGTTTYVSSADSKPTYNPAPVQTTPREYPVDFQLADYDDRVNGPKALQALAEGRYQRLPGGTQLNNPATFDGLIYVEGDVKIMSNAIGAGSFTVTIVAEGEIHYVGPGAPQLNHYMDGLLFFSGLSGGCNTHAIHMSNANVDWTGMLFAPHGWIHFSMARGRTYSGSIIGNTVKISAAQSEISFDSSLIPPVQAPPEIGIAH